MGFLIFAYRKLSLKRRINQKEYRQMLLSQEQQQIQSQISIMQQAQAATQDFAQQALGSMANIFNMGFQGQYNNYNQSVSNLYKIYQDEYNKNDNVKYPNPMDNKAVSDAFNAYQKAQQDSQAQYTQMVQQNQTFQYGLAAMKGAVNSIFEGIDKNNLEYLHTVDSRITLEMSSLESQLKMEKAELEGVEKAEGEAAKDTAPKFGLA